MGPAVSRRSPGRKTVASDLAVLVGVNLVPLAGVVFFGWDPFTVVFLYWLENVIGVFYIANQVDSRTCLSFGLFTLIQGIFVVGMLGPLFRHPELARVHPDGSGFSFNPPPGAAMEALADVMSFSLLIAILALVGEYAYASRQQGKGGHYVFAGGAELFVRIVPLHLAIILGAIWMVVYKLSDAVVVVLVAVKISVEVVGYLWQSRLS